MKHLPKRYKTFAIFLIKTYHFFNSLFLFYFGNFGFFCSQCILVNFGCVNFRKICGVPENLRNFAKFVEFLIFQPQVMLNLRLTLNESQLIYDYKRYAYKKECTCIPRKRKPFCWIIILAYFAVSRNANDFVHKKLTQLLPSTFKMYF